MDVDTTIKVLYGKQEGAVVGYNLKKQGRPSHTYHTLPDEVISIAQHYRDRADSENVFDELNNQWGWGGFTTQDLKRCRLTSRCRLGL